MFGYPKKTKKIKGGVSSVISGGRQYDRMT